MADWRPVILPAGSLTATLTIPLSPTLCRTPGLIPHWRVSTHNKKPFAPRIIMSHSATALSISSSPSPAGGGTLSFWYWTCTFDFLPRDWQDAYVTDSNGAILQTIFHQCSDHETWVQQTVDMGPYAGQRVRIKFLVHQDGRNPPSDITGMYVDDVQLSGPCGTPSPTPTATATATPTPT